MRAWTDSVTAIIAATLPETTCEHLVHVFSTDDADDLGGFARRLEQSLGDRIAARFSSGNAARATVLRALAPTRPDVQVAVLSPRFGFLSMTSEAASDLSPHLVSPLRGGRCKIPPDRGAPSRAYRKLLEAEIRLGRSIETGQSCVDLGASPGSWSYVALSRGAQVVAVDRSPLRSDLAGHPRLTFTSADAFAFEPDRLVDWLLCDVAAHPDRSFGLLQRWVSPGHCRHFCVTLKLKGRRLDDRLEAYKRALLAMPVDFQLTRLIYNQNEVTALGTVNDALV